MYRSLLSAFLLAATATSVCRADILYNNTTTDSFNSVFYSTAGYTQIGDQIQLIAPANLTSLETQFFNAGASAATFDVTLSFYRAGAPLGSQIGTSFTLTGISIDTMTSQNVLFSNLGGLLVPADVVMMFAVQNVSAGGDIGLNFFNPPTVGSSSETFFLVHDGSAASQASTLMDIDNLHAVINGTAALPEPSTLGVTLGLVGVLLTGRFKRGRVRLG